jgi:branched-chain amino acid transport system substrate-binding protein
MTVNMKMKLLAAALGAGLAATASAQVSGNVVKIGFATDMSGLYSDIDGPGGVEAIKMAIADFGGQVNGKKIELLTMDHQNKADVAAAKSREWIDQQGADLLIGGINSGTGLAMSRVAADKKRVFISVGAGTARLTNEECTPYTINYVHDTVALARGTGAAVTRQGGKTWFFLAADYAFGAALEKDTGDVVKATGGKVVGSVKHPLSASDFSSFLMQAQSSRAQVLGLANAGGDLANAIKSANEFGISKSMKMAAMMMFITDVHAMGLNQTKGMYLTSAWYWDQNDKSRAFAKRYYAKMKKMPSVLQAGNYSATMTYLNAVRAAGTDDADKVMAKLKSTPINDMFTAHGVIRPDGRMVHDMYLAQVKSPAESKYPWDYYKIVQTIPGEQAYNTKAESKCSLWK